MSAPLQPVSMRKGRAHLPRLSAKHDPAAPRHARYWTAAEDAVMRVTYPGGGAAACLVKLPGRTLSGVYQAARRLKLPGPRDAGGKVRARHGDRHALDDRIREAWPGLTARGSIAAFANSIGRPRWWVLKAAMRLGLTVVRVKELPWSAAEDDLMRRIPLHDPEAAAKIFREHGHRRTPTAIVVRSKRLNLKRRYKETMSARNVARILGVDDKAVTLRCIEGTLKAVKRPTRRLPQQGGDPWSITRADLRQYVIDHLDMIDIRKVDKVAFVDLLVNAEPAAAP